jgi:hypothetical protein
LRCTCMEHKHSVREGGEGDGEGEEEDRFRG